MWHKLWHKLWNTSERLPALTRGGRVIRIVTKAAAPRRAGLPWATATTYADSCGRCDKPRPGQAEPCRRRMVSPGTPTAAPITSQDNPAPLASRTRFSVSASIAAAACASSTKRCTVPRARPDTRRSRAGGRAVPALGRAGSGAAGAASEDGFRAGRGFPRFVMAHSVAQTVARSVEIRPLTCMCASLGELPRRCRSVCRTRLTSRSQELPSPQRVLAWPWFRIPPRGGARHAEANVLDSLVDNGGCRLKPLGEILRSKTRPDHQVPAFRISGDEYSSCLGSPPKRSLSV